MADLRETILAQLLTTAKTISGVETCERNLDDVADIVTPAILLFDGDEEAFDNPRAIGMAANVVTMQPIFEIHLGDVPENVGTTVNGWRATLLKTFLTETTIATA